MDSSSYTQTGFGSWIVKTPTRSRHLAAVNAARGTVQLNSLLGRIVLTCSYKHRFGSAVVGRGVSPRRCFLTSGRLESDLSVFFIRGWVGGAGFSLSSDTCSRESPEETFVFLSHLYVLSKCGCVLRQVISSSGSTESPLLWSTMTSQH